MKHWEIIKGFIIAPLVPSGLFSLLVSGAGLISGLKEGADPSIYIFGGLILFGSALPVAYSATILLGVPGFLLYKKKEIKSLKAYVLGGAGLGLISPALLLVIFPWSTIIALGWLLFLISTTLGVFTSYSFWRISVKGPNHALQPIRRRDAAPLS